MSIVQPQDAWENHTILYFGEAQNQHGINYDVNKILA